MYFDYSSPPPHNSSQALPTTLHPPNSLSTSFLWLTKFNLYYPCAHGCRGIHWSVFRPPGATYWKRTDSPRFRHLLSVTSSPVRGLELVSSSQPPPPPSWNVEGLIFCTSFASSHSSWDFMGAVVQSCSEETVWFWSSLTSGSYTPSVPLSPTVVHEPWGWVKWNRCTTCGWGRHTYSLSKIWVSVLIVIHPRKRLL